MITFVSMVTRCLNACCPWQQVDNFPDCCPWQQAEYFFFPNCFHSDSQITFCCLSNNNSSLLLFVSKFYLCCCPWQQSVSTSISVLFSCFDSFPLLWIVILMFLCWHCSSCQRETVKTAFLSLRNCMLSSDFCCKTNEIIMPSL